MKNSVEKEIEKKERDEASNVAAVKNLNNLFEKAKKAQQLVRDGDFSWDDREQLFFGKYKNADEKTKSILSSGELATLAIDGSCRVMAQLPSGRFYNFNGDTGANMLINLIFEHYVIPNATLGGNLLAKLRMVDMYSRVLPIVPVFIEWVVTEDYVGPDMIIVHPRRFFPQPGKTSIEDMDYCFIETEVSKEWLKERNTEYWMHIGEVLDSYKEKDDEGTGPADTQSQSPKERGKVKTGITIRQQFTKKGDWSVWYGEHLLLDEKEWFTGISSAVKQQYPVLDSLYALNDFDRGQMTQKAIDSLFRMYLDGVGMSIEPPAIFDPNDVVLSSIVRQRRANWFVKSGKTDAIRMADISPKGLSTFQGTYQILKANLLSLGAQTDTSISKSVDEGFGKTPQALKMQGERQGARDAWDSFMMEQFIERVFGIMADMIAKKGIDTIAFQLLGTSIEKIKEQYPSQEVDRLLGHPDKQGKVSVDPESIRGKYRYIIDSGSTLVKQDDTGAKMVSLLKLYAENPQIAKDLEMSGQKIDFGEIFKRIVLDQGIKDSEKFIVTRENPQSLPGVGRDGATVPETPSESVLPGEQDAPQVPPEVLDQLGVNQ